MFWTGRYTVYTVLFGPHAPLSLPEPPPGDMRFVVVTDHPASKLELGPRWEVLSVPTVTHPQKAARHYKMFPDLVARRDDVCTVWMDATFVWSQSPDAFVDPALLRNHAIAGLVHPDRRRMVEETAEVIRVGLAPEREARAQATAYQAEGFDTDARPLTALTTTGLLLRKRTDHVNAFNALWAAQLLTYTLRDQLSIDYCAWKLGLPIGHLTGSYRQNPYARYLSARRTPRPPMPLRRSA